MSLNSKYIHTNLAIHYLYQYANQEIPEVAKQIEVKEYTINNEMDNILRDIIRNEYDVIFVSAYIWNIDALNILFSDFKKINRNTKIYFGGPEVSYDAEVKLSNYTYLDGVLVGEGELTFVEFVRLVALEGFQIAEEKTEGIVYRRNEMIISNRERALITNLDIIPFPYTNEQLLDNRILYYESSRGCPYSCSYCLSSAEKGVRNFSLERVFSDLERFLEAKVPQVKFVDRTFNANKKHAIPILKYLTERDNGITNFHFEITASLLNEAYFEILQKARPGLFQFEVGIQTTNEDTLFSIKRPIQFEKVREACKKVIALKTIHLHVDLIAGLPYEGYDSFLKSFDQVYEIGAEQLQLGFLKILKGTLIDRQRELHAYIVKEYAPYEVMQSKYLSYSEMCRLKEIESLIESYYNSGKFKITLAFLKTKMNLTPSQFYLKLSDYYLEKGYFNSPVGVYRLYEILFEFGILYHFNETLLRDLLKYDYYAANLKGQKSLFNYVELPQFNQRRLEMLKDNAFQKQYFNCSDVPAKQLLKNLEFITLTYDIMTLIETGFETLNEKLSIVMFDYHQDSNIKAHKLDENYFTEKGD